MQRSAFDSHAIPAFSRHAENSGDGESGECGWFDLPCVHRQKMLAGTDDRKYSRSHEDWQPVLRIEAAEEISGKQRLMITSPGPTTAAGRCAWAGTGSYPSRCSTVEATSPWLDRITTANQGKMCWRPAQEEHLRLPDNRVRNHFPKKCRSAGRPLYISRWSKKAESGREYGGGRYPHCVGGRRFMGQVF